ncbi:MULTISPECIES: short coiled-coil protein [unclassified Granulicatella]|uniref:short coiled-coil protein n=1 Tax=unclassified Granulicatella TaxID=2630493 RepID=UPI001073ECDD|nr:MULTISPECIES: short coiled-coil protein [unclassified Granulicatella]MBF0780155.1 short coiled-coil protein [Granulicatella sp. 19428wC4_WM01]TFU95759.1 hypothetical protein E4T68_03510 [Granulicatella sp. WM01]
MNVLINRVEKIANVRKKHVRLTRFERVTLVVLASIIILLMASSIYTRSLVSEINVRVETIKEETQKISVNNQVLQQKIDDLMTYDRIVDIATKYGLKQNEKNVKAVTE